MGDTDWKDNLAKLVDEIKIIETSISDSVENFSQFCEFIAEPAFESLSKELRDYRIKSKFKTQKGKSIALRINFPRSRTDHFHYIIVLPKNSLELKLKLRIMGRKDRGSPIEKTEKSFMENLSSSDILKLSKEDLIQDVIEHHRIFNYETIANSG